MNFYPIVNSNYMGLYTLMSSLVVLSPQPLKKRIHPGCLTALAGSASSSSFGVAAFLSTSPSVSLDVSGVSEWVCVCVCVREREMNYKYMSEESILLTHIAFCSCFACFRSCCFLRKYASLYKDKEYIILTATIRV